MKLDSEDFYWQRMTYKYAEWHITIVFILYREKASTENDYIIYQELDVKENGVLINVTKET